MTPKQKRCLDAIQQLTKDGVPPSFDELREHLGLASKSGVHRLVHGLAERGYIAFQPDKRRTLQIVSHQAEEVPFERMAEAAIKHVQVRWNLGKPLTKAAMRQALVDAFRSGAAA